MRASESSDDKVANIVDATRHDPVSVGKTAYQRMRERFLSDPENQRIYEEEAAKSELWLQLVEARIAAGLTQDEVAKRMGVTQSQVSRLEKASYDAYTLNTLRRYAKALGEGFAIEVRLRCPEHTEVVGATGKTRVHND